MDGLEAVSKAESIVDRAKEILVDTTIHECDGPEDLRVIVDLAHAPLVDLIATGLRQAAAGEPIVTPTKRSYLRNEWWEAS